MLKIGRLSSRFFPILDSHAKRRARVQLWHACSLIQFWLIPKRWQAFNDKHVCSRELLHQLFFRYSLSFLEYSSVLLYGGRRLTVISCYWMGNAGVTLSLMVEAHIQRQRASARCDWVETRHTSKALCRKCRNTHCHSILE